MSVSGGSLSGFGGSGAPYTATFTPTANSTTPGSISVPAGRFTDPAGNANVAGQLSPSLAVDTVAPTIAIASSASALRGGEKATITFTLSESANDFFAGDVTVSGGTKTYCVFDNGVLARFLGADLTVELLVYRETVDEDLFTP